MPLENWSSPSPASVPTPLIMSMHQGETHRHSFHSQAKVRFTHYLPHQNRPPKLGAPNRRCEQHLLPQWVSVQWNITPHLGWLVLRICFITGWGCSSQWHCRYAIFNRYVGTAVVSKWGEQMLAGQISVTQVFLKVLSWTHRLFICACTQLPTDTHTHTRAGQQCNIWEEANRFNLIQTETNLKYLYFLINNKSVAHYTAQQR